MRRASESWPSHIFLAYVCSQLSLHVFKFEHHKCVDGFDAYALCPCSCKYIICSERFWIYAYCCFSHFTHIQIAHMSFIYQLLPNILSLGTLKNEVVECKIKKQRISTRRRVLSEATPLRTYA